MYRNLFELKKAESSTTVSANELPNSILEDSDANNVAQKAKDVKQRAWLPYRRTIILKEGKVMAEQMRLETYKQKVRECLMKIHSYTGPEADSLITKYEDDFQELLGWNLDPQTASGFLASGLY